MLIKVMARRIGVMQLSQMKHCNGGIGEDPPPKVHRESRHRDILSRSADRPSNQPTGRPFVVDPRQVVDEVKVARSGGAPGFLFLHEEGARVVRVPSLNRGQ